MERNGTAGLVLEGALCASGIVLGILDAKEKKYLKAVVNFMLAAANGCLLVSDLSQDSGIPKSPKNTAVADNCE